MPKISIIMPNCNYAQYLTAALDSVLAQTFQDWECIVIDDGSRDDSVSIIRRYMAKDKRIRLIELSHAGIGAARNAGLDAATGEYIAFLDSDDCYTQTALEVLYTHAVMLKADIIGGGVQNVFSDFVFCPANAMFTPCSFSGYSDPNVYLIDRGDATCNWLLLWRRLWRRDFIGSARFDPHMTTVGEDITFVIENIWRANQIVDVNAPVAYHRLHDTSSSTRARPTDFFDYFIRLLNVAQNVSHHYSPVFCRLLYTSLAESLIKEAVLTPNLYKTYMPQARKTIIQCAKMIPLKYLSGRRKLMFWYLSKLKDA